MLSKTQREIYIYNLLLIQSIKPFNYNYINLLNYNYIILKQIHNP